VKSHTDAFLKGLTTGPKNPSGKGKRLIVVHIGSADGFVEGGLLCFESKKNTADYHDEMNGDTFYDWFCGVLPRLKENCVIVMDNASYHSVKKDPVPTTAWKKEDIQNWLKSKGVVLDKPMIKFRLLDMVDEIRPRHEKYVIDEEALKANKLVLRLPPYHCELNPIELAWSVVKNHVKQNNTSFKLNDVRTLLNEGVQKVTSEMWANFVRHTIKEEDKFYDIDIISDRMMNDEDHIYNDHYW
jgi:transposase